MNALGSITMESLANPQHYSARDETPPVRSDTITCWGRGAQDSLESGGGCGAG